MLLSGGARLRRYFDFPRRNQDEWFFKGLGRLDLGTDLSVTAEGQADRTQEEPFTGEARSDIAALSSYRRNFGAIRGQYQVGRIRTILAFDHQDYSFNNLDLADGSFVDQRNRNRSIERVSGQFEYGFTPTTAAYLQASYESTDYATPLAPGIANRDSTGFRTIAGLSVDTTGLFRGIVGIGYTSRDYNSPLYKDVSGVSAEARLEYFESELTTFTLDLRRVIEDSNIGVTSAYFDTRVSLRADHELLRQLILSLTGEYATQDYIDSPDNSSIEQGRFSARYLASRALNIVADLSFAHRDEFLGGDRFSLRELAGGVSLVLRR